MAALRKTLIVICALLLSLSGFAEVRDTALLHVPKNIIDKPLLFGSRIVEVNRSWGKVFSDGQRNPRPKMVEFIARKNGHFLILKPMGKVIQRKVLRGYFHPVAFKVLEETPEYYTIDVSQYFCSYPEIISAIPENVLGGPAEEFDILGIEESDKYIKINARYSYATDLQVTAACYLIYLREDPMPGRTVDPALAGYNGVDPRTVNESRAVMSHRWYLTPGRTIDFYVDKSFPEEWYPYIKEGIEDWNKAFRNIGFGDVLAVHHEPADSSFDRYSPLINMVRYMDVEEANAKGDVLVDPRSGEILQADILWWKQVTDLMCKWRYVQTGAADPEARKEEYPIEMFGPMIRHAICHEMGHALGLSHNMGASWAYPTDSLRSVSFTAEYGSCASVMDYARYNHLATAADVAAGVNLLPPRLGPYDYYAIALGYGEGDVQPGRYCYFAPFISAAISPDPSAQSETLGNDLLRSSDAGIRNCRALLKLDGLTEERTKVLRHQYYSYIWLALSNIGGVTEGQPVSRKVCDKTLAFVFESMATVPLQLVDVARQKRILDELEGNFLPERVKKNCGENELKRYYRRLHRLQRKYDKQLSNNINYDKKNL